MEALIQSWKISSEEIPAENKSSFDDTCFKKSWLTPGTWSGGVFQSDTLSVWKAFPQPSAAE